MKRVLVAEDNDSNWMLMTYVLKKDYEPVRACNGKEAVEMALTGDYALVVMDLKMPVLDGLEATRQIKAVMPNLPIIALTANAFDSDTERLFSIILEEDRDVIRWIKPPLNQLGLFWKAGQQYNPDFLVETTSGKYMVEVKAANEINQEEVVSKAREGIKWCRFASTADPDHKKWEYKLISDDNIHLGNTCKYTLGTAHTVKEENDG